MNLNHTLITLLAAGLAGTSAAADAAIERNLQVDLPSAVVWNAIGDFCDLDDWHPDIAACRVRVIDGSLHRVLRTTQGAEIIDRLVGSEPGLSYTYSITSAPISDERIIATLSVESYQGTRISWSARVASDDPAVEAAVVEMLESGMSGISQILAGN